MTSPLPVAELEALDAAIEHMLASGRRGELAILGAGEITCVFGWRDHACKRLPPFAHEADAHHYAALLDRYVTTLRAAKLTVLDTALGWCQPRADKVVAYVVQRAQPRHSLLPSHLREAPRAEALALFRQVLAHVVAAVSPRLGLDAQLTNWCLVDGTPCLLDTTTPLMRDEHGAELLPTEAFVSALPSAIRWFIRRYYVKRLLDRFYAPREVMLDVLGNLINHGLDAYTDDFLAETNRVLSAPLTRQQIDRYRRQEALTWRWLRRLLRVEQLWRRKIRRSGDALVLPWQFQD